MDNLDASIPLWKRNKAEYNKKWRESHLQYHRDAASKSYYKNKEKIMLKQAYARHNDGKKVNEKIMLLLKENGYKLLEKTT
jgi:hypothetical protein